MLETLIVTPTTVRSLKRNSQLVASLHQTRNRLLVQNRYLATLLAGYATSLDGEHPHCAFSAGVFVYMALNEQAQEFVYTVTPTNVPIICKNLFEKMTQRPILRSYFHQKLHQAREEIVEQNPLLRMLLNHYVEQITAVHPDASITTGIFTYLVLEEEAQQKATPVRQRNRQEKM